MAISYQRSSCFCLILDPIPLPAKQFRVINLVHMGNSIGGSRWLHTGRRRIPAEESYLHKRGHCPQFVSVGKTVPRQIAHIV